MAKTQALVRPKRGEVYLVNFNPTIGSEIRKTRPALILQNDVANRWSSITIVAAIASRPERDLYISEVAVDPPEGGLTKPSRVLVDQIRSVDKQRLVRRMGSLGSGTLARVNHALRISLGLVEL